MWGRAGQIVLGVISIVLLYPARPFLQAQAAERPFVAEGRAFASYPEPDEVRSVVQPAASRRTLSSYVRRASAEFVAPAKRTAVIVGINHAQGTPPLPGSVADARNLHDALIGYGFKEENITLLLDGQATKPAILGALKSLAARTPSTGVAVFAIAAHTRRAGSTNHVATAEGARISSGELAAHLRDVQAPAWIALPTCYAAGYALPGIVGFNRIATFASSADRMSYQAGDAGSFLFIHMVRRAMLEGRASFSVETAYNFAYEELSREHPEHVPSMTDGYPGDLVLGPSSPVRNARWEPRPSDSDPDESRWDNPVRNETYSYDEPSPTPAPRRRHSGPGFCGSIRYNC